MQETRTADAATRRDALAGRLMDAALGLMDLGAIYIGDQLGLYRGLERLGPATSIELAAGTGTHERYVREWLEQQAVAGFLSVDDPERKPGERRYQLPVAHRPVFADEEDLNYLTPLATLAIGVLRPLNALLDAYRSGGGSRTKPTGPTPERGSAQSTDRSSSTSSANGSHPSPRSTHA
jgi:Rv2258c-like winged HTH domain